MYNKTKLRKDKTMKKNMILLLGLFVCLFVSPSFAAYYEITNGYTPGLTLENSDTLLMIGGGVGLLTLEDNSSAIVKGTSTLQQFSGGIWELNLNGYSHLDFSGGELKEFDIGNNATAILTGGFIQQIWSYQWIPYTPGRDGIPVPNIKLYYSGVLPTYNQTTDILTGLWGNGTGFSIYLHDVAGYDPVIENIEFILIPEPATLLLLSLGGLLLRRK
jgi:hypothetical protein